MPSIRMPCTSRPKARSGWRRAAIAMRHDIPFTTAYHTRFPEYIKARIAHAAVVDLCVPALVPRAVEGGDGADQ